MKEVWEFPKTIVIVWKIIRNYTQRCKTRKHSDTKYYITKTLITYVSPCRWSNKFQNINDNKNRYEKNGEGTYLCPVYRVKSANNKKRWIVSCINGKSKAPYATPKVTKYQRCNFIIQIHQFTIKIDKININLLYECVKIVEFNFNSHVFHVMYQETRFLNQGCMFFKSRRETTIFDQFCFRERLKPSIRVGIQGLKVLTGLLDSCSSQIDWS